MNNSEDVEEVVESIPAKGDHTSTEKPTKLPFIRPQISVPVDVLEATTFFQVADSGTTN